MHKQKVESKESQTSLSQAIQADHKVNQEKCVGAVVPQTIHHMNVDSKMKRATNVQKGGIRKVSVTVCKRIGKRIIDRKLHISWKETTVTLVKNCQILDS